jgi:hypothetical protein
MPTRGAPLFHVIDPRVFERPLLDELCALATRVRMLAKSDEGARALRDFVLLVRPLVLHDRLPRATLIGGRCRVGDKDADEKSWAKLDPFLRELFAR